MKKPSRAEIQKHLLLGGSVLRELMARGDLPREGTLDQYREAYILHLRERAAGRAGAEGLNLADERARLARAQAIRIEMENDEVRGEVARWEDVEAFVLPLLGGVAKRLLAVPAAATPEAHGAANIAEAEAIYRRHQNEALSEVSEALAGGADAVRHHVADQSAVRRRRVRNRASASEPADGESVGGSEAEDPGRH